MLLTLEPRRYSKIMVALLILSTGIFELAINIFLPILPALQDYYHTTPQMVQYSISTYLFGFSLLGLIAGPLSDFIGRRRVMLTGLILFWLGSMLSYWYASRSLSIFLVARFIQGLGAGISTVLVVAIVRDLFTLVRAAQILSLMGMIIAVSPMIAPLIGGVFAEYGNWSMIFLMILALSKIILIAFYMLGKESIHTKSAFKMRALFKSSRALLKNPECMGYLGISALVYGVLFAWITQAPFFFEELYGLDDLDYAVYASLGPLIYIISSFVNYGLLKYFDLVLLLRRGLWVCVMACVILFGLSLFKGISMWAYLGTFLVFNIGLAFVFSNTAAKAVDLGGDKRGTTSAYLASMEQFCAGIATSCVGVWGDSTLIPTTVFMVIGCLCAGVILLRILKLGHHSA